MFKKFRKVEVVDGTVENTLEIVKAPLADRVKVKLAPAKKLVKPLLIVGGIAGAALAAWSIMGAPSDGEVDYDDDSYDADTEPAESED